MLYFSILKSKLQKSSLILISIGCNCNTEGSKSFECDNTDGSCTCKPNNSGEKCEKCTRGLFGFPNCNQSKFQLSTFPKYILICFILQCENVKLGTLVIQTAKVCS